MSLQLNQLNIAGNMARDVELRHVKDTTVIQFAVATNRNYKDNEGNRVSEPTFVDCEAWGKTADFIAGHFSKGDPIFVTGRLKQQQWADKDGKNRSRLLMVVESAAFVESKPAAQQGGAG